MKINNIVIKGGGSSAELAVNTTWAELKAMRDNSQLTEGCLYRITDYETIISGVDVQYAGHPFDIIVLATDVNVLSEDAMAVRSARDTEGYFANSKLEAWELKYCLDNDTTRFAWASEGGEQWIITVFETIVYMSLVSTDDHTYDGFPYKFTASVDGDFLEFYFAHLELQSGEEFIPNKIVFNGEVQENEPITQIIHNNAPEGKGVIWYMKDEFNNLCYYDFKNVLFKRYLIISTEDNPTGVFHGKYAAVMPILFNEYLYENYIVDAENYKFLYTFSFIDTDTNIVKDFSIPINNQVIKVCTNNVIKSFQPEGFDIFHLNNNVFVSSTDDIIGTEIKQAFNTLECNSCQNTFIGDATYITFEEEVQYNLFANNSYMILFKKRCSQNVLGENAFFIEFGMKCDRIKLEDDISNCHILSGLFEEKILAESCSDFYINMVGEDSQGNLKIWNPADLVQ